MNSVKKLSSKDWTLQNINDFLNTNSKIVLDKSTESIVKKQREKLEKLLKNKSAPIYGINTGFGSLCNTFIEEKDLEKLQENLIKSHACGIGNPIEDKIVRTLILLKVLSLSKGNSAIRIELLQFLIDLFNKNGVPYIPEFGSLGASGDLAPLSHLSLCILGEGKMKDGEKWIQTKAVLKKKKITPISLKAKEGLALINGTQFSLAMLYTAVNKARKLYHLSNFVSALSFEAFNGRLEAFDSSIHVLRNQVGQKLCAEEFLSYFKGSNIQTRKKQAVQDPYSFRCIPQVHGASLDVIHYVESIVEREINSVTDNPLLVDDLIISGGNFHAQPLALAGDFLSIAVSELGSISERRTYQLVSGSRDLPDFLANNPGLESGYMIVQYAAASIASLNKSLCSPSSVDSIISSKAQEDHVSMAPNAMWKCIKILDNVEQLLTLEWIVASRAIHFRNNIIFDKHLQNTLSKYRKKLPIILEDHIPQELYADTTEFFKWCEMPVLKYALIFFNLCLFAQVIAQNPWQWSVEYNLATLRKHTPRMVFTPSGAAHGLELKLFKRTAGNKRWENYYNAPSYGFMAKFFYLGAPREILGNAYSFYPFIEFNIGKKLHLFLSDGIAYFPKPYNIKTNPNQNAIGSHWNRSVCFKALWNVYNFERLSFFSGVGITHYSNGSIKSPNLGLNFPSIDFQIRQNSVINSEFIKQKNNERLFKKWSFSLLYGIAMKELKVTGGPKFFVYTLAVDGGYHYSDFKSIRVGIEEEYHNVSPYFYIHTVNVDKIDPFKVALRHQVFVSHEWQIGQSAISLSTGYRLNKEVVLGGYALYNKLIVSYRFPKIIKRIEPSLGMILKVNYGVADHLALCLNLRWHKTKTKME